MERGTSSTSGGEAPPTLCKAILAKLDSILARNKITNNKNPLCFVSTNFTIFAIPGSRLQPCYVLLKFIKIQALQRKINKYSVDQNIDAAMHNFRFFEWLSTTRGQSYYRQSRFLSFSLKETNMQIGRCIQHRRIHGCYI